MHDRDREPALLHEPAGQQRHRHHQPEAVRAERHHEAVEGDDLPERGHGRAGRQPAREEDRARRHQRPRAETVDQRSDEGRADPDHELGDGVGHRGLGPAPPELPEVGDQEDRVGVHQALRDRVAEEGARHHGPARDQRPSHGGSLSQRS